MKILKKSSDGGKNSGVTAYFLIEWKKLFSIALLRFSDGTRKNYHTHAFDAITWFVKGKGVEEQRLGFGNKHFSPSFIPKITRKDNFHRIKSIGTNWAITFRGRWQNHWSEYNAEKNEYILLTHGRKVLTLTNMEDE